MRGMASGGCKRFKYHPVPRRSLGFYGQQIGSHVSTRYKPFVIGLSKRALSVIYTTRSEARVTVARVTGESGKTRYLPIKSYKRTIPLYNVLETMPNWVSFTLQ